MSHPLPEAAHTELGLAVSFWVGFALIVVSKFGHHLWNTYREHERLLDEGKRSKWTFWYRTLDFWFETPTTVWTFGLTFASAFIVWAIWIGAMVNWWGFSLEWMPHHPSVAIMLGGLSEAVSAPFMKRIAAVIVNE